MPKWSPNGIIILAKYQPGHSYTFLAKTILIFSLVYFFLTHPLVHMTCRSPNITFNFDTCMATTLLLKSWKTNVCRLCLFCQEIFKRKPSCNNHLKPRQFSNVRLKERQKCKFKILFRQKKIGGLLCDDTYKIIIL